MKRYLFISALALIVAGPVHAQRAEDVEAAIVSGIEELNAAGANISYGSRAVEDGSVFLRGVRMAPDEGGLVVEAEFLRLTPSAAVPGDVTVTVSPLVKITAIPTDGTPPMEIALESQGLELVTNLLIDAAGKPAFSFRADSLALTGGDPDHPMLKKMDVRPENLSVSFAFDEATRNADATLSMDAVTAAYTITDPTTGYTSEVETASEGQRITFSATSLPSDEEGIESFAENGGEFRLLLVGSGGTTNFSTSDPAMPVSIAATGQNGSAEISVLDGSFLYRFDFGALDYVLTPNPEVMPLPPFTASMASGAMEFRMPVTASDEKRDLKLALALNELVLGDTVWGMIDPEATIPRDPATLELDLTAEAVLARPLAEAGTLDNPMELGQIESIDVNRLYLTLGGATIEADGGVLVDNSGFMPMPDGAIDVSVAGLQGLAQKLVALGLVDQMQVGMMMGMMMAFATPGEAPDSFTSKIEFRDGGIFANGQQLQ